MRRCTHNLYSDIFIAKCIKDQKDHSRLHLSNPNDKKRKKKVLTNTHSKMLSHALELSNQDDCKIFQNPNIHQIQTNQPKIPIIWLRNDLFYYVGSHTTNSLLRKRGMDSYLWSTKVSNLLLKLKSHFNWFRGRKEEKHVDFDVSKIIMCKYNLILNFNVQI